MMKRIFLTLVLLLFPLTCLAQVSEADLNRAWQNARLAALRGPTTVSLSDQGELKVPTGMSFIPPKEGAALLATWGTSVDESFQGMVVASGQYENWYATLDFFDEGFVTESEALNWDTTGDLWFWNSEFDAQTRRSDESAEIIDWISKPLYDSATRSYATAMKVTGHDALGRSVVFHYYTHHLLGREGIFHVGTVWDGSDTTAGAKINQRLVEGISFVPGKHYDDHTTGDVISGTIWYIARFFYIL